MAGLYEIGGETREERAQATLEKIWNILGLWTDEQWSSNEIEEIAQTMISWYGYDNLQRDREVYEAHIDDLDYLERHEL